ncbi:MAG: hypothetical protein ACKO3G_09080, partial [Planctomycetaceae bacterium]
MPRLPVAALLAGLLVGLVAPPAAAALRAGAATVDITPARPAALWGQMHTRVSTGVASPITATVLVLDSDAGGVTTLVACDLVAIPEDALAAIRKRVAETVPDVPVDRIVTSATHTHTAPVLLEGVYEIPPGVTGPGEYVEFLATRVAEGIREAWASRGPCTVGWGMGHAVVAHNRR